MAEILDSSNWTIGDRYGSSDPFEGFRVEAGSSEGRSPTGRESKMESSLCKEGRVYALCLLDKMDRLDMKTASSTINGGLVEERNGGWTERRTLERLSEWRSQATAEAFGDCLRRRVFSQSRPSARRILLTLSAPIPSANSSLAPTAASSEQTCANAHTSAGPGAH